MLVPESVQLQPIFELLSAVGSQGLDSSGCESDLPSLFVLSLAARDTLADPREVAADAEQGEGLKAEG